MNLIEKSKKENILLVPEIRKYWAEGENNQLVISQLGKSNLKVYLLDDVEIIEKPIAPTLEVIEDELKKELDEAIETYKEEFEKYNSAEENGFVKGVIFHPDSYLHKEVFIKINKESDNDLEVRSVPWEIEKWLIVYLTNKSRKSKSVKFVKTDREPQAIRGSSSYDSRNEIH